MIGSSNGAVHLNPEKKKKWFSGHRIKHLIWPYFSLGLNNWKIVSWIRKSMSDDLRPINVTACPKIYWQRYCLIKAELWLWSGSQLQTSSFLSFGGVMWARFIHSEIMSSNCGDATAMHGRESKRANLAGLSGWKEWYVLSSLSITVALTNCKKKKTYIQHNKQLE